MKRDKHIKSTNWLTKGYTKEELARMTAEAIKEAEAEIRDKQIEEMANDIAQICPDLVENCCGQINCVTHLTLSLSKMGYRKASEGALEVIAEIEKINKQYCTTIASAIIKAKLAELKKKYTEDTE